MHHEALNNLKLLTNRLFELKKRFDGAAGLIDRLVEEYKAGFESRYIGYPTPLCDCNHFKTVEVINFRLTFIVMRPMRTFKICWAAAKSGRSERGQNKADTLAARPAVKNLNREVGRPKHRRTAKCTHTKNFFDLAGQLSVFNSTMFLIKKFLVHCSVPQSLTNVLCPKLNHAPTESQGADNNLVQLVTSRINLVDLAGSERLNSAFSAPADTFSSALTSLTSSRLKESTCINKSLLTLGKIICLLSERQNSGCASLPAYGNGNNAAINSSCAPGANGHLPYRESVLTWLLKESLGGNAKTAMLATANASSNYLDETICTLRYAAKTATIKNSAHLNRNFKRKFIDEFGMEHEMNLALAPINSGFESSLQKKNDELQKTLHLMECEWKQKLDEAERLKQKEIKDLEKSLIVLYEKETSAQNCCLINLNEDPLLSEKLIYVLKNDNAETVIGSDRNLVNIHLTGALIAAKHCAILSVSEHDDHNFYLQQTDESYETFLNGELIKSGQRYLLSHGDRIIVGGSHFFRFNNPKMAKGCGSANSSMNSNFEFKDYQFAKNEVERKQNELMQKKLNEVVNECKRDGDMKIKELTQQYEKNIQSIKNLSGFF
ncbi:kinesin KIF14 [Brachionus plicatilis]|uniref:Kinesin-like protein n=1 Tax=Brachionus plicatilis TaxID=10195 RepID=A0A3M7PL07_BRAPC|nr:kinesin KIF14 [Brachionus plicatilis]